MAPVSLSRDGFDSNRVRSDELDRRDSNRLSSNRRNKSVTFALVPFFRRRLYSFLSLNPAKTQKIKCDNK